MKNYWMKYAEVVKGVMMFEDYAQRPRRGRRRLSRRRQHDRPHTARLVGCICTQYGFYGTMRNNHYSCPLFFYGMCFVKKNMLAPGRRPPYCLSFIKHTEYNYVIPCVIRNRGFTSLTCYSPFSGSFTPRISTSAASSTTGSMCGAGGARTPTINLTR